MMKRWLSALLLLGVTVPAFAQTASPPNLPSATPKEVQLRIQLGEAMWELGMTQASLAAITKERDDLKAGKSVPQPLGKSPPNPPSP